MTLRAHEIGRGLAPRRPARPITGGERIHVLGAAGAGASAAVLLAHHAGAIASGCDAGGPSPYSAALLSAGLSVEWQHSAAHVDQPAATRPERLAVTKALTAIDPDHPELVAARERGIPAEPWQQVIADAAATTGQTLVAVAGTHGKSTTSGWLVDLLVRAGRDPSAFVGALLGESLTGSAPGTARWGRGDLFVVEADEYAGNFDPYRPATIVMLNAEWDHPDVFADTEAVLVAFETWIRRAPNATLVANVGDDGVARLVERLSDWPGSVLTASLAVTADVWATPTIAAGRTSLAVRRPGKAEGTFEVHLPGPANAANALAVIAAAHALGVEDDHLRQTLARFDGVGRRLELKGDVGGVIVLDDYGHHPTAIERTLEAVRGRYPERRVWAVYEPLTFHRTALMLDRFADVLSTADVVAVADIWPGRDTDTTLTSSQALADAVNVRAGAPAVATGPVEATAEHLSRHVRPGDVVLVMGGGRSYVIAARLVEALGGA